MTTAIEQLELSLGSWLGWYRLRRAVVWAARGLTLGLMAAFGFSLVARLEAVWSLDQLIRLTAASAGVSLLAGAALSYFAPISRLRAARYFDRAFGLEERTSTALEIARGSLEAPPDWTRLLMDDAIAAAEEVNPRALLPISLSRIDLLSVAMACVLVGASLAVPNEQFTVLAQQQAVRQAVAEQVTQLEAIRQEIEENPTLTEEQVAALTKPLNDAISQLQSGDVTQEQAVSVLTGAQDQLQQLADPNALQQAQSLQQAGQQLSQNEQTQAVGEQLQNNDLGGAAESLSNIDVSQMSAAQMQQLGQSLESAAQSLAETNPQLSQQLQQAADALNQGDASAAQQALSAASQTLETTASQVNQAEAASVAAQEVGSNRQQLAQAGGGNNAAQGGGGQTQTGQGQSQGQGGAQGQQGAGSVGAGQGAGSGALQGSEAGDTPIAGNNNPGDGGVRAYEPIYAPIRIGGSGGQDMGLSGSGDPGGDVVGQGPSRPPTENSAQVPYTDVYQQYNQAAQHAINSGQAPVRLKPVIRSYFSSLEP